MNILIVDDNKNNRMILRLLLEDYMDEHSEVVFSLDEAENGQVAVDKCSENNYEIILMDIMMPVMDGIEATKKIRVSHPKTMIIAISAVDDTQRQKLILNSGAEDYIAKPVNSDIFISRITNYITLCETRKKKVTQSQIVANLFTKNVFSRHTRFLINSEDALLEFWEFYLLSTDVKSDGLSDVIRTIYGIAEVQRKLNINSDIFVESSESKQYFTLSQLNDVPKNIVELTLKKNEFNGVYKLENTKISFELDATSQTIEELEDNADIEIPIQSSTAMSSVALEVFDYIDEDDLLDLEEFTNKLNSIMMIVGGGDVTQEEVMEIVNYLERIASVLSSYSEIYVISKSLSELSLDMSTYCEAFRDNSEALGPMCKAFASDMSSWIEKSFHTGAPSVDFMNETIAVNCKTISGMLKVDDSAQASEDFDDIFDF